MDIKIIYPKVLTFNKPIYEELIQIFKMEQTMVAEIRVTLMS